MKDVEGKLHPLAYFLRNLNSSEKKWRAHDQELGEIIASFKEWSSWVMGSQVPIIVFLDHSNLRYVTTAQLLTEEQAR